ncbi:MAG: hypothetical protein J6M19_00930 [Bacteroidaceae bacterium]|nr:hypothetical protein [Bacteroidaceae bacterium]
MFPPDPCGYTFYYNIIYVRARSAWGKTDLPVRPDAPADKEADTSALLTR